MKTLVKLVGALLALVLVAGCGSRQRDTADKAGGTHQKIVLRLGVADDDKQAESALAAYFAGEVATLSDHTLRVEVVFGAGSESPAAETRVARLVRSGRFDLGWIGSRAWDELGVKSFQALQAPFLIDNDALLDKVVKSPLADEMLAGLKSQGVVGLALIPGLLRHAASLKRPLVSLRDFARALIQVQPSRASDALFRALGAIPVHIEGEGVGGSPAFQGLDGHETSFPNAPVFSIVTGNLVFFPKVLTLFANDHAFASLGAEQRKIVEAAARRTLAHATNRSVRQGLDQEGALARRYCRNTPGRVALADEQQLDEFARAARPVYAELERNPQTRQFVAAIRRLKASLPRPPRITVAASCMRPRQPSFGGSVRSPSLLNGTYHWRLTKAAALAFGPPASTNAEHSSYPIVFAAVLRDGKMMTIGDQPTIGTYTIRGDYVTFLWDFGYPTTFTFIRDRDGTVHLKAVQPMDRGDEFVLSGGPWRRVGPPVVAIP